MKELVALSLIITLLLTGCNSNTVILQPEIHDEIVVEATETKVPTEQVEENKICLTQEQITGNIKPMEKDERYFSFSEEYRAKAEEIFNNYMSAGLTEAEAINQAIEDVVDIIMAEESEFLVENYFDYDENGVPDGVDRGEYTQSELDTYPYKWYAGDKKKITDYYASLVKQGEFTKEEAEYHINRLLNSTENADASPLP